MMRHYRYLFYRIYTWAQTIAGPMDSPGWQAVLTMSLLSWFALLGVLLLLQLGAHIMVLEWIVSAFSVKVAAALLVFLLHSLAFLLPGRPAKIVEEFSSETPEQRTRGTKLLVCYICGPFLLFAFAIWMTSLRTP